MSIEGSIGELCLSADNDAAGFSAMDYAIPAGTKTRRQA